MNTASPVALDEPSTWPNPTKEVLESVLRRLRSQAPLGVVARSSLIRDAERKIDEGLQDYFVVAYHCTRLAHDEIEWLRVKGLLRLEQGLMRERIAARLRAAELSQLQAGRLLCRYRRRTESTLDEHSCVWAVLSHDALKNEYALGNPLRFWGGEVLLDLTDESTCATLANIGTACILEFSAPIAQSTIGSIAHSLLARSLWLESLGDDDGSDDVCFKVDIPPGHVRRLILRSDVEFERFTSCSAWKIIVT